MIMKFKQMSLFGRFLLFVLAGGITAYAFAPRYAIWVLPLTVPFLFWQIQKAETKKKAFCAGFGFGFGLGACSTSWIANALMIDGGMFAVFVPAAWFGMGLLFGLFWGIPAVLATFWAKGYRRWLVWAVLMTLFEWVRSWFLTGFPWNLTGAVWENTLPVLQSASVWGVYGLSLMTLLVFSSPVFWPQKKVIAISFAGLAVVAGLGAWRLYDAGNNQVWGVNLRIVQPNIPQTLKWNPEAVDDSLRQLLRLSRQHNEKVTHVIWPETAVSFLVNWHHDERARLMSAVPQGGTLITGGLRAVNPEEQTIANSLFVLDDLAGIQGFYDKAHLVPFGEYVPLRDIVPLDKVVPIASDIVRGKGLQTIHIPKAPPAGPLVCYEVIFSGQVVSEVRPGWLVNVTNDGWYGISAGPYQHLGMAKMRAVEEGLPVVRAANTGVSAVFDGYGRTIGSLPLGTEGVLDTYLPEALSPTLYARGGVWIPIGLCGLIFAFLLKKRK